MVQFQPTLLQQRRVSPNIAASIPRLELMGAVVGVRPTTRIVEVLGIQMTKSTFWCDSVNVLWWVRGRSRNFKPFVAHRVGEIQTQTDPNQWRYVPTKVNPADMLSRGMPANDLAKCNSWWRGPAFFSQTEDLVVLRLNVPVNNFSVMSGRTGGRYVTQEQNI